MEHLDALDRMANPPGGRDFGEFGGVNASVEVSTTFTVLDPKTLPAIFEGELGPEKGGCYVYGRAFNPTVRHLGRLLAAMEGTEAAYPTSSGMAAISATLLALCDAGSHIVASNTIYGGTHALLKSFLPAKCGVTTSFVDITDLRAVERELAAHPNTRVLYTEVVSNPTLRVADIRALADLAHSHVVRERGQEGRQGAAGGDGGAAAAAPSPRVCQLVVDNTFTPLVVTPKRLGADVVVHSLTKYISGASDIIAGVVCGSAAFVSSLMDFHTGPCMLLGPTLDPRVASELALRLPHLALRVAEHGRRAGAFASRLAALGAAVTYPGLPGHPQHGLMAGMSNEGYGFGGLLGLDFGTAARANTFMERLQNRHGFGFMAVSLGYFDSLMSLSAASTSSELAEGELAQAGIGGGYVRLSVGITGTLEERWRQLEESYRFVMQLGPTAVAPYRAIKMRQRPTVSFAPTGAGAAAAATSAAATANIAPAVAATATGAAALAAVVEQHQLVSWPSLGSFDGVAQLDGVGNGGGREQDEEKEEVSGGAAAGSPGGPASSGEAAGAVQRRKRARLSSDGERLAEKLLTAAGAAAAATPVEAAEAWPAEAAAEAELGPLPPLASMLMPPVRGPLRAGGGGAVKLRRVGSSDVLYVPVHGEQAAVPRAGEVGHE